MAGPARTVADAASKVRAWRRLAGMAALLVPCVPLHYLWRAARLPSLWPMRYMRWAGWCAGAEVRTSGRMVARDVLIVANHISWLDILLLAGASGVRFVSKSEVRHWPFVGWLAGLNRTVYVARAERGQVHAQAQALFDAIGEHRPVALFPEGTTGDGRAVGPFRASLLAAMVPPPPGALLQPVVLDYGREAPEVAWSQDTSFGHEAMRLLAMAGRRRVAIRFLDPIDPLATPDRKALAAAARGAMVAALGAGEPNRL